MLSFKNLLLAFEELAAKHPEAIDANAKAVMLDAREWLQKTKTFEYYGQLTMPHYQNTIKLPGIKQDLDDVIKSIANKRNDIDIETYLCLVVSPKPIETTEAKANDKAEDKKETKADKADGGTTPPDVPFSGCDA